jgi:hypothetical protein
MQTELFWQYVGILYNIAFTVRALPHCASYDDSPRSCEPCLEPCGGGGGTCWRDSIIRCSTVTVGDLFLKAGLCCAVTCRWSFWLDLRYVLA